MPIHQGPQRVGGVTQWVVFAILVLLPFVVFRELLSGGLLFMTDNNIGFTGETKRGLPLSLLSGYWLGGPLIGNLGEMTICLRNVAEWVMPLNVFVNWWHAFTMSLFSLGVTLCCFRRGCIAFAVMVCILSASWMGSHLSLVYCGHDGKYGVLAFAGISLLLIEMAAERKRASWSILSGGSIGMMFAEQQDVALFIAIFLGAYAVYAILRENAWRWKALVAPLLVMGVMAAIVGGPNVLSGYTTYVKGVVAMSEEKPQQKWEYCTQWSLPPDELIELIAPRYFGIRSGEPEGPYWGRMGRSAGWEQTRQGFQNFKLNSEYQGAISIVLALFAVMLAFVGWRGAEPSTSAGADSGVPRKGESSRLRHAGCVATPGQGGRKARGSRLRHAGGVATPGQGEPGAEADVVQMPEAIGRAGDPEEMRVLAQRRGDILFWGIATVVALLLSLGKYFPLYALFYQIPGMSSIRNPVKFIHVFQIGIGILAAFGADALVRGLPERTARSGRIFAYGVLAAAGGLLLWTASLAGSRPSLVQGFVAAGWGQYAPVMVGNMVQGAFHAAFMTAIVGAAIWCLVRWRQRKRVWRVGVLVVLVLVMVGDVLSLSRDYIKTVKLQDAVGENAVTSYLKQNLNQQRALMLSQEGFYNNWLMVLFPYHHIETFNVSQMPRMPEDYDRWLKSVGRDPIRLWQLSAIGYVLAPDPAWQQIQKEARFAPHFEEVKGFNVFPAGEGLGVAEVAAGRPAQHRILRFKNGLPRFKLYDDWEAVSDAEVGERLVARDFNPHSKVWVAAESATGLPARVRAEGSVGTVLGATLSPADAKASVDVKKPAVLMFVNKHSLEWRVSVDGRDVPLLRCNSVCLGVYVEPGKHEVRFYLRKQWGLFLTQMTGLAACLVALAWLMMKRYKRREPLVAREGVA